MANEQGLAQAENRRLPAVNCSLQVVTSEDAKVILLGWSFVEGEIPVCL